MASDRSRTLNQRFSIWGVALISFLLGGFAYTQSTDGPIYDRPLGFYLQKQMPSTTGLVFKHELPDLDPVFDNVRPWLGATGASACVGDVDEDGLLDVLMLTADKNQKNKLFHNVGDFKFETRKLPEIENLNQNRNGYSTDCNFADVNNDGYDDLIILGMSRAPNLYLNVPAEGTKLERRFENITAQAGLPEFLNAHTSNFVDFDNDGDLDLFIAALMPSHYDENTVKSSPRLDVMHTSKLEGATKIFPNSFGNATNGGRQYLLLNDGTGKFIQQDLKEWGFDDTPRFTWDVGAADINRDGFTDIYLANDFGPDDLFINQGGKGFKRHVGVYPTDVGRDSYKGMDAEIADINNDGYPEIYVSNIFHPFLPEGNLLWMNHPEKTKDPNKPFLHNAAAQLGVQDAGWGWGGKFVDLDLDGDKDLVVTNGMFSQNEDRDYWFDLTRLLGSTGEFMSDSKNLPMVDDKSLSGFETSRVFVNEAGHFYNRAEDAGITHKFDGRGVLLADFDVDGRVDILFVPQATEPELVRNVRGLSEKSSTKNTFLGLKLSGDGERVNTNAAGSRVKVTPASIVSGDSFKPLYYEISMGNGFASQSTRWISAGIGEYKGVVDVEVWWTDGKKEMYKGLTPGKYHQIKYGNGEPKS